jgi:NADPH:quinone reductase-like Zn-dependent oxidoreductase
MRAIAIHEDGTAPTMVHLPRPEAGPGEVLVRVRTSSLNGFDVAAAAGMLKGMMEHRFPVVLGKDFAGTVEAIGEDVDRFAVGDPVFGVVMKQFLGDGALGEFVAVSAEYGITRTPDRLEPATAGALGLAGTAAVNAIDAVKPQAGETVLISGATGGVGAIAIQYAAAAGARVVATALPGAEADFVRELGADHVVDHTGDLAGQVREIAPDGVHAIVHLAGDAAALTELLVPDGRLASTIGFGPEQDDRAISIVANPDGPTLDRLAGDAAAGRLRVPVSRTYALNDVPTAFADFAAGTVGKLAVTVPEGA